MHPQQSWWSPVEALISLNLPFQGTMHGDVAVARRCIYPSSFPMGCDAFLLPVCECVRSLCAAWDWVDITRAAVLDNEAANPDASRCCFSDCVALFKASFLLSGAWWTTPFSWDAATVSSYFWFSFLDSCLTAIYPFLCRHPLPSHQINPQWNTVSSWKHQSLGPSILPHKNHSAAPGCHHSGPLLHTRRQICCW